MTVNRQAAKRWRIVYVMGSGGGVTFLVAPSQESALIAFVAGHPNVSVTSVTEDLPQGVYR